MCIQRSVGEVLSHPGVDTLVSLEPPLETLLASPHERLDAKRTARELKTIRELRGTEPKTALLALAEILKRIRNCRAHGFKTPYAPRDQEILAAAAPVMRLMAQISIRAAAA